MTEQFKPLPMPLTIEPGPTGGLKILDAKGNVVTNLLDLIETANHLAQKVPPEPPSDLLAMYDRLTPSERYILHGIARGLTTRQIAEARHRSVKTVETQRAGMMEKLNLHGVAEVIRFAALIGKLEEEA